MWTVAFLFAFQWQHSIAFQVPKNAWHTLVRTQSMLNSNHQQQTQIEQKVPIAFKQLHRDYSRVFKLTASTVVAFVFSNAMNVGTIQSWQDINQIIQPPYAAARNLPTSNGASGANRGTAATLAPIIKMKKDIDTALAQLPNVQKCEATLSKVTNIEKDFKKVFDEHSEGISYKQQFLDQNAFLVYYTKGFDGPGRPSIEEEDSARSVRMLLLIFSPAQLLYNFFQRWFDTLHVSAIMTPVLF